MIETIFTAIKGLLQADEPFLADIRALGLGKIGEEADLTVLGGLRPAAQVPQQKYPAALLDLGDSEAEALSNGGSEFSVIGFTQQGMAADILIGLIWHQQDRDTAVAQRLGINAAFVDLFLRHPDPGGAVLAWVRRVDHDRGGVHPTQTTLITVRVEYAQQRTDR